MKCPLCENQASMMAQNIYFRAAPFQEATTQEMGVTAFECKKCENIYLYPNDEILLKIKEKPKKRGGCDPSK